MLDLWEYLGGEILKRKLEHRVRIPPTSGGSQRVQRTRKAVWQLLKEEGRNRKPMRTFLDHCNWHSFQK